MSDSTFRASKDFYLHKSVETSSRTPVAIFKCATGGKCSEFKLGFHAFATLTLLSSSIIYYNYNNNFSCTENYFLCTDNSAQQIKILFAFRSWWDLTDENTRGCNIEIELRVTRNPESFTERRHQSSSEALRNSSYKGFIPRTDKSVDF